MLNGDGCPLDGVPERETQADVFRTEKYVPGPVGKKGISAFLPLIDFYPCPYNRGRTSKSKHHYSKAEYCDPYKEGAQSPLGARWRSGNIRHGNIESYTTTAVRR
jgi:hypothetical protein